jgi:Lactonase, 7-bladed beta-propeller
MKLAHGWVVGRSVPRTVLAASAVLTVALCLGTTTAAAAPGDMSYRGCITGNSDFGPTGTNACAEIADATSTGANSGLDNLFGVAVSPDGKSLYALSHLDDAIARFTRDPASGALTYQDCITGRTETTACAQLTHAKPNGAASGFDEPYGIAISPDGASIYVAAQEDDSIAIFSRDTSTGALTYEDCITGEIASAPVANGGNDSCGGAVPGLSVGGANSGIDKVRNLAIDPDGESLYATSGQDDSLYQFSLDPTTGAPQPTECLTAETETGPSGNGGSNACTALPPMPASFGTNTGFDNPQAVTVSPDGANVYVGSGNDASITTFTRAAGSGDLTRLDCLTKETASTACTVLPGDELNGFDTGFDNIRAVAVSPDGSSLYSISGGDAAIVQFNRDAANDGALDFQNCLSGDTRTGPSGTVDCTLIPSATDSGTVGDASGWFVGSIPPALAIEPDGSQVYFGTGGDDSLVQLDRSSGGSLTFRHCLTSETESATACTPITPAASFGTGTALDQVNSLAMSPDGASIYTTSWFSDDVASFAVEQPPVVVPPVTNPIPTPPVHKNKKKKCKKKHKHKRSADSSKKKKCKKKKRR